MKIRIKFRRWGSMKFLGHLDMMRYFQRAVRRADIDIKYSEGFSPHQIMSFAAPLGVGITSDGEYFDIEVNSTGSSEAALKALNDTMVEGIAVTGYVALPDKAKTAMSIVAAADYILSFKEGYESPYTAEAWKQKLDDCFFAKDTFEVIKKTAKSQKTLDLKKLVYELEIREKDGRPAFYLQVCTGSTDNIKPEFVLEHLYEALGIVYNANAIQIHRLETYAASDQGLIPLLAMGEEIL